MAAVVVVVVRHKISCTGEKMDRSSLPSYFILKSHPARSTLPGHGASVWSVLSLSNLCQQEVLEEGGNGAQHSLPAES